MGSPREALGTKTFHDPSGRTCYFTLRRNHAGGNDGKTILILMIPTPKPSLICPGTLCGQSAANRDRLTQSIRSAHNNQTQFSISYIICYILPAGFVYMVWYRILPTGAQNSTLVPITLVAIPVQANPSFKHNFLNENSNQNIIQGLHIAPPDRVISVKKNNYIKTNVLHI